MGEDVCVKMGVGEGCDGMGEDVCVTMGVGDVMEWERMRVARSGRGVVGDVTGWGEDVCVSGCG